MLWALNDHVWVCTSWTFQKQWSFPCSRTWPRDVKFTRNFVSSKHVWTSIYIYVCLAVVAENMQRFKVFIFLLSWLMFDFERDVTKSWEYNFDEHKLYCSYFPEIFSIDTWHANGCCWYSEKLLCAWLEYSVFQRRQILQRILIATSQECATNQFENFS
jgi:hypothetical protein